MKILFITRGYPNEKYKTNGIFEFDQAKAIASLGHQVIYAVIDLRSIRRWRKWGIERLNKDGVEIYAINIPLGRVPEKILRFFGHIGLRYVYKKIVKDQGKPDIMHAHFTELAYLGSKLKDIAKIPLITTEHSSQINKDIIDKSLYQIAKISYRKSDLLLVVSLALSDIIEKNFSVKSTYIPNIVDLDIFKHDDNEIKKDKFNFVSIGNLIDTKRMDLTIEAFYEMFRDNTNATLTIFGQGPKRKVLEDLIIKYDLGSQVKLMGLCPREQIAEQLKKSHCFVLASQSETFGVAYIEALAMGVPVIATKCGGPEGFINDRNGVMVDIDSLEQLSLAMKYMYENNCIYNRKKIAEETQIQFSPGNVGKMIVRKYEEVLKR